MSATIYRSIEVYTAPPACLIRSDSGFPNQDTNFVVALAEVSVKPAGLQPTFEWRIDYVGSLRYFSLLYCSDLANAIQDGSICSPLSARGANIYGVLGGKMKNAEPLTAKAMHRHNQFGYCWSHEQFSQLKAEHNLTEVDSLGAVRYAARVRTDADVHAMVQQSMQIAEGFSVQGAPGLWYFKSTPGKCDESALGSTKASA